MPEFDPLHPALRGYLLHARDQRITRAKHLKSDNVSEYRELMAEIVVYDKLLSPELGAEIKAFMDGTDTTIQAVRTMEIGNAGRS